MPLLQSSFRRSMRSSLHDMELSFKVSRLAAHGVCL
jgi:hypothetical protein